MIDWGCRRSLGIVFCSGVVMTTSLSKVMAFGMGSGPLVPPARSSTFVVATSTRGSGTVTRLAAATESGGRKKKRRRRKDPSSPSESSTDYSRTNDDDVPMLEPSIKIKSDDDDDDEVAPLNLPDIRDALMKKKEEKKAEEEEEEEVETKVRISRTDEKAMRKLMEAQPFADADASNFEVEKYGTVSALLGEGAKSFLGIPSGPLQVGHFIGALVVFLMAFVEYPGFPLTNLPTPLRGALQGGLGTTYLINTALAILATFKAGERGQSPVVWGIKTFSVGGLALDQLTQLPTLVEIEEAKNRKGKRALKKNIDKR